MKQYVKDDNAKIDYVIDWSSFLGEDTIDSSTWTSTDSLWAELTDYVTGEHVRLSSGEILEIITAGTSASVEPSAPAIGSTVEDGTVTWLRSFSIGEEASTDTTTTIWAEGGTFGQRYSVVNHIVTDSGREDDETLEFIIIQK